MADDKKKVKKNVGGRPPGKASASKSAIIRHHIYIIELFQQQDERIRALDYNNALKELALLGNHYPIKEDGGGKMPDMITLDI